MNNTPSNDSTDICEIAEKGKVFSFKISSDMDHVDFIIRKFKQFIHDLKIEASSNLKLVIRELLINAIEHGNRHDFSKCVTGTITSGDDLLFTVTVRDEGKGFDHES